ncbi:unnamed protein product [Effrenium voratum]|nr:unnamed protein product [Effrenium voratum]
MATEGGSVPASCYVARKRNVTECAVEPLRPVSNWEGWSERLDEIVKRAKNGAKVIKMRGQNYNGKRDRSRRRRGRRLQDATEERRGERSAKEVLEGDAKHETGYWRMFRRTRRRVPWKLGWTADDERRPDDPDQICTSAVWCLDYSLRSRASRALCATWRLSPMMSSFKGSPSPDILATEPQKTQQLGNTLQPGLEHRPFTDDEIKEAFATFDLDNNRFVGAAEISHILKLIGEDVSHQEIDEMIRMCDSDGDGQVTFDEFYKMMTTAAPPFLIPGATRLRPGCGRRNLGVWRPPPVMSNKKKPYSDQLGGAKRYAKQLTETGPTFAQKAKEDLSQHKGDWRAQQAAAAASAKDRHQRSMTVEALIHKLSGGMGKIKPSQIKKIYKRFGDIDVDKSGAIDYEEFIQAMDMEDTNIARRQMVMLLCDI